MQRDYIQTSKLEISVIIPKGATISMPLDLEKLKQDTNWKGTDQELIEELKKLIKEGKI
jgi:hypothetical protein